MHAHSTLAHWLADEKQRALLARAEQERLVRLAVGRGTSPPTAARPRRAAGAWLVGVGERLRGAPAGHSTPATGTPSA